MKRLIARVVYLFAIGFLMYTSFGYVREMGRNTTPSHSETRSFVSACQQRTGNACAVTP